MRLGICMGRSSVLMADNPYGKTATGMTMREVDADTTSMMMVRQDTSRQHHQCCQGSKKESKMCFKASAGHLSQSVNRGQMY